MTRRYSTSARQGGQLLTRSGITLISGETYTVVVAADDGIDIARITVSIEAIAGPPNNPPVFTEGATATRSVSRSAALPGRRSGSPSGRPMPMRARRWNTAWRDRTAAAFGISATSGQILTVAGVTLDQNTYTVEVLASDGTASARITVTINVVLNNAPTFASSRHEPKRG